MNNKLKTTIIIIIGLTIFLVSSPAVLAQVLEGEVVTDLRRQDAAFLAQAGFNANIGIGEIISYVVKLFLSFLGVIFIILIIYAGFLWMTSTGNEEKISKGKNIMASAIIGLAIVLAAYIITYFVIDNLLLATLGRHL